MHWIYLIHEFHNLSWITEINELFHDILIYWDAPVYMCVCVCVFNAKFIQVTVFRQCFGIGGVQKMIINYNFTAVLLTLSYRVWLNISIIVLAGPDKPTFRLHDLSHHVINQPMLIPDTFGLILSLVLSATHTHCVRMLLSFFFWIYFSLFAVQSSYAMWAYGITMFILWCQKIFEGIFFID